MRDREKYNAYQREYQRKRWHKRRQLLIESLGGKCYICGCTENLQFDHKDPKTKVHSISDMATASDQKVTKELAKCQLLCKECHKRKTFSDMNWQFCETEQELKAKKRKQSRDWYYRHRESILAKKRAKKNKCLDS